MIRIGQGYDAHKLVGDRELWLCGVKVPHTKGLLGHSDADVAIHALCDAMLGALALGDIGKHFPDSDPAFKGIDSKILLSHVCRMISDHGDRVGNADITIMAQRPKLAPYIAQMRDTLAAILDTDAGHVSVKATTTEGLGFEGKELGISASAAVLLFRK